MQQAHALLRPARLLLVVLAFAIAVPAAAQGRDDDAGRRLRELLTPVVEEARRGVMALTIDGEEVGLATVVDGRGYLVAKASELDGGRSPDGDVARWGRLSRPAGRCGPGQ